MLRVLHYTLVLSHLPVRKLYSGQNMLPYLSQVGVVLPHLVLHHNVLPRVLLHHKVLPHHVQADITPRKETCGVV